MNVQVPSPLSAASGPPAGSQLHQGPVNLTDVAVEQTLVVMRRGCAGVSTVTTLETVVAAFPAPSDTSYVIV